MDAVVCGRLRGGCRESERWVRSGMTKRAACRAMKLSGMTRLKTA